LRNNFFLSSYARISLGAGTDTRIRGGDAEVGARRIIVLITDVADVDGRATAVPRTRGLKNERAWDFYLDAVAVTATTPRYVTGNYDTSRRRSSPNFFMRLRSVLALSLKIAAAPFGPSMR
jgi:hypothetical protein